MKLYLRAALAVLATGCLAPLPPTADVQNTQRFDPIAFFTGVTHGEGKLYRRFNDPRSLRVEGHGTVGGDGTLTLDQVITYADGAVETRRWVVRRIDSSRYVATLSDASGEVAADVKENRFHLKYRIRSPRVFMEQWLVLGPDGRSVDNRAEVTMLGVPWMHLSETIIKVD